MPRQGFSSGDPPLIGSNVIITSTTTEDDIIEALEAVIEAVVVPDDGPALRASKDGMLEYGNASTYQNGAFTIALDARDTGQLGGSGGYQL